VARGRSELFLVPRPDSDPPFTGERFTFAASGVIEHEHTHRYFFALDLCRGRDVLDIASGEGYGSAVLGLVARSVAGVDIDAPSVVHARRQYGAPHVRFVRGEATAIPLEDATVDVAVSFETLEHIGDHERFLAEVRRVLRPGGLLIISSPDRNVYSPTGPHNPYHVKELDRDELDHLLRRAFRHVSLLGQRSLSGSCLAPDREPLSTESLFFERLGHSQLKLSSRLPRPMYLLAVASDRELPPLPSSLLLDGRYANWLEMERQRLSEAVEGRARAESDLGVRLAAARDEVDRLRRDLEQVSLSNAAALASRDARVAEMAQAIERKEGEIAGLVAERERLHASATRVPGLEESLREHARQVSALVAERDALRSSTSWRLTFPLRWTVTELRGWAGWMGGTRLVRLGLGRWRRDARIISDSGFFDAGWYAAQNPDVASSGLLPLEHFAKYGAAELRDPHPLFSTRRYVDANPDVARLGMNAVVHFVLHGRAEGRGHDPARPREPAQPERIVPVALCYSVNEQRLTFSSMRPESAKRPVLCVTHVPPWPRRAGNEYRIGRLLDWLSARGHTVVVVLASLDGQMPPGDDLQVMAHKYGNVVMCLPDGHVDARLSQEGLSLTHLDGGTITARGAEGPLGDLERRFCHDTVVGVVLELERRMAPCALYVNYIFMTRFLPMATGRSVSFVDTIDVFSTKRDKVVRFGIPDPLSVSPEQESACLRRADAVVAIQSAEASLLAELAPDRPVLTIGVDFDTEPAGPLTSTPTVLCIGSDNALNVRGLRDFLRFAWPLIRRELPAAKLLLAGKAAKAAEITGTEDGIEVRGVVEDLGPLYRESRVAINPAVAGTGLKIKTMDALRHFRAIVTFPHGVDGVTNPDLLRMCRVVTDWYEFAYRTVDALRIGTELPGAEAQARISRALSADSVYEELGRWLDRSLGATRAKSSAR
jgi:SAM-dependent methyltransferase